MSLHNDGNARNVIIADDSIFVIQQLRSIFSDHNFSVIGIARNGAEAVEQYKRHHPNVSLLTLDVNMPKMDGIEALKQILEFDRSATVVMVTTLSEESFIRKALMLGAKGYILKPLNRGKVMERIERVMSGGG